MEKKDEQEPDEQTEERQPEEAAKAAEEDEESPDSTLESKYRLILVAAQRSKQLQKGARIDVASKEVPRAGTRAETRAIKALDEPSSIGIERIRSAVKEVSRSEDV